MQVRAQTGDITQLPVGAAIVNLFEGVSQPGGGTGAVDQALGGAISHLIAAGEIKGKKGEVTLIHTLGKIPPERVLVVGLGKQEEFSAETVRYVSGEVARSLRRIGVTQAATITHGAGIGGLSPETAAQALTEGTLLGLYSFRKHKASNEDEKEPQGLTLVEISSDKLRALEEGIARGTVLAEATALCRDMVNEPSNEMTPSRMAEIARQIAEEEGLEITVLERPQCEELGMGAFLGVARGSNEPPKFIVLRYWGDRDNPTNSLALVGKGITFDSGGISIKPAEGMGEMKGDMAGGAVSLCSLKALARLKAKINVTAIVPATENLPGGSAQKPGDIRRAMNGKTIEVDNTDAEGRLVLADAICYARQIGIPRLVDIATLTGAIRIALGDIRTGLFGNNQELIDRIIQAGQEAGERMWQLPLDPEYKEQIKSQVADIKNTGGRLAGSITGAHFIGEFAEDTPWAHLDIAGTAWTDKEKGWHVKGATGVPLRTLVTLALALAGNK